MLNPKAMAASRGGRHAAYLWKEAVVDLTAQFVVHTALDQLVEEGADYEELIDFAYQQRLARVQAAIPPDHHHVLHGIDGIRHGLLRDKATEDVQTALDRYEVAQAERLAHFGVQFRPDTSPELAELLGIDLYNLPSLPDLKHLLSARTADGQQIPSRFYRTDRPDQMTMGSLALVFSPDKSVSVVYGLSSPEERRAIIAAQRAAVDVAMHQLGNRAGFIRSRRGGVDKRDPGDVTWVQWQHHLSRRGDPQLNTHVSLLNVVRSRVDGKVGTLDTFILHGFYPTVRETYHRALTDELRKIGLAAEFNAKVPAAVIPGIPEQVLRHFSGRTADAEQWLQEKLGPNFASLTPHQRSNWLDHAAAKTRPTKAMYYVPGNGHEAWHARAVGQGYVPPPRFIDPRILQQFNVVHTTVSEADRRLAGIVPPPVRQHAPRRQNEPPIRRNSEALAEGERKQRGWWRYDELSRGHGLYHGHKL